MEVQLTPDQKAFARHAIETGRIHDEEDVVQEALGTLRLFLASRVQLALSFLGLSSSLWLRVERGCLGAEPG